MYKRAILYIAWGKQNLEEALDSAAAAAFLGIDRVLITTQECLSLLRGNSPFARVIVHPFDLSGLLAKSEMPHFLPEEYDSFLFLDTDTRILMDIRFGFEKAETFGIAAAMAPHYSLEHFWGFGRVLSEIGHPHVDTMQYNTGVLFFIKRPDVRNVLEEWYRLCRTAGASAGPKSDQPYFTLAMEQLGFNPYTLSPAYNYRNSGQFISGLVRIWHSRHAPPPDVNVFATAWPPRAFHESVRLEYRRLRRFCSTR